MSTLWIKMNFPILSHKHLFRTKYLCAVHHRSACLSDRRAVIYAFPMVAINLQFIISWRIVHCCKELNTRKYPKSERMVWCARLPISEAIHSNIESNMSKFVIHVSWCYFGWQTHQTLAFSHITRFISVRCMRATEICHLMRNFRIKARILNRKTYRNEHYERM